MPNYRIQYRRDTAENWQTINPILLDGEVGYEITDQEGVLLQKVGDGVMGADGTITGTHWNDLPYVSGPIGPAPEHEWEGSSLRFRNPNGTWGDYTNLQGPQGIQGNTGPQGEPGTATPATKTTLGGIIVGEQFDITPEGCLSLPPMLYNSEEWITESGSWTAPVTGWYEVWMVGGGSGGSMARSPNSTLAWGGDSGAYKTVLIHLVAGDSVDVVVGAGGIGAFITTESLLGSQSSFGAISTGVEARLHAYPMTQTTTLFFAFSSGAGIGGGYALNSSTQNYLNAFFYGGGGGSFAMNVLSSNNVSGDAVGNGYQGAIRLRFWNPDNAAGPIESKARMALARSVKTSTVNLYNPETGQGSVWREEDVEAKLAEGLITQESWMEICKAKAAEDYAEWLANSDTTSERFSMLRAARDAKLAETDYLVTPDYPITTEQRAEVVAYRQALRDLPEQPGAPWDGGGELTPWPVKPNFVNQ